MIDPFVRVSVIFHAKLYYGEILLLLNLLDNQSPRRTFTKILELSTEDDGDLDNGGYFTYCT